MPQQLSGNTALTGSVLFLDPIVKDQARMGSSNMPGGSTPVSSASMMSGQFCHLSLVLGVLKHLFRVGWVGGPRRKSSAGRVVLDHLPGLGKRARKAAKWVGESDK